MASPTIYSWQDANAPSYFATAQSFQALIRAVMVDGYTGKVGAGWTIPFSDASSFVLQQAASVANPTAPKQCIKFFNYHSSSIQRVTEFQIAENYTDLNTPVSVWAGDIHNDFWARGYATNTTTYEIPWMIFATTRSVYFLFGYNANVIGSKPSMFDNRVSTNHLACHHEFFGDIAHTHTGWLYNQMGTFHNGASFTDVNYTNSLTGNLDSGYGQRFIASEGVNHLAPDRCYLNYTTRINRSWTNPGTSSFTVGVPKYPSPINGGLYLDKVKLTSNNAYLGELPGLLYPFSSMPFAKNGRLFTFDGSGDFVGQTIYTLSGWSGQLFIRSGEWGVE